MLELRNQRQDTYTSSPSRQAFMAVCDRWSHGFACFAYNRGVMVSGGLELIRKSDTEYLASAVEAGFGAC